MDRRPPADASVCEIALEACNKVSCLDCYGPDRSILATDWPVASLNTTFDAIYDTFRRITADLTDREQSALFHDNARRLYRME